jgi:5S rRNA maturation endonuclease (ribonuclease M5)
MGDNPQVVFRVAKLKSVGQIASAAAHNARLRPTPNADPSQRSIEYIDRGGESVVQMCKRIHKEISDHCKKNKWNEVPYPVLASEVVMSASPEYFRPSEPERAGYYEKKKLDDWVAVQLPWFKEQIEKENSIIVSLTLHLDETTPHFQAIVIPRNARGELSHRKVFGGEERGAKLVEWQTRAAVPVAPLGIVRGVPGSKAVHRKIKDYYAGVNAPEPVLPPVQTLAPAPLPEPTFGEKIPYTAANSVREAMEAQHAAHLAQHQKEITARQAAMLKAYPTLKEKAKSATTAVRDKKQAERRLEAMAAREKAGAAALAEAKAQADMVRALPLEQVLVDLYGAVEAHDSKEKYASRKFKMPDGSEIAVTGEKWVQQDTKKGGSGAINLVMHLEGLDQSNFKDAVRVLADRFGTDAAASEWVRSTVANVKKQVKEIQQGPTPKPTAEFRNWPRVRRFLTEVRGLPGPLIDYAKKAGLLYADTMANAVFPRSNGGAFLRGSGPTKFTKTVGGKADGAYVIPGESGADCFFCEAPIDSLSIKAMRPDAHVIAAGGNLLDADALAQMVPPGTKRVWLAHDNDPDGERLANNLQTALAGQDIEVKRAKPVKGAKDWNDVLRAEPWRVATVYGGPERPPAAGTPPATTGEKEAPPKAP